MAEGADRRDFFISHAGPDTEWAEWIGQQLEGAGYTVELDVWDWSAGTDFVAAMQRAMNRADRVVAVWSGAYFGRMWTRPELRAAFAHSQLQPGWLVPVVIDACDDQIPILYRTLIRVELAGLPESEARTRLLDRIRPRGQPPGRPAGPVAFPTTRPSTPTPGAQPRVLFPGGLPPVWGPVPGRNLFFTGRGRLLDQLHDQLAGGTGAAAIAALHGFGGVGKTQLAAEYAWRYAADYDLVWWVDAQTPAGMAAGLAELAGELGLAGGDAPSRMRRVLAELSRRDSWLLVYDNVTGPAALARHLPPSTGHLIVTCRDPQVRRVGAELVEVGEFARDETLALLRRHVPELAAEVADRLADVLGDLPLAVDQAGAYLAETGMDPDTYLNLLAETPQAVLADETLHHAGLAATVAAARDQLAGQHPAAAELLDRLAFLAPEPIPLAAVPAGSGTVVAGSLMVADPATTHTVIAAISRLALARRSGTSLRIHRLVHALLRTRLAPEQAKAALTGAVQLLATGYPGAPSNPDNWLGYAALAPHVTAVAAQVTSLGDVAEPADFRELLLDTCWYLRDTADRPQSARTLADQARTRWSAALGDDHPHTQTAITRLAAVLGDLGDHQAARELDEENLARRRRLYGDDHPGTLASAHNLAVRLADLGELQAARELTEDTLARYRRMLGDDHPDTLQSAGSLAHRMAAIGEFQAARELEEDTLARWRRVLGDDHPYTLGSANSLAFYLAHLGEVQAARELAEDTLTRRRRVFGDDHPYTLGSATYVTAYLAHLGEHRLARELGADTLARQRRVLGEDHPDTLTSAARLADALAELGEHEAARELGEATLARRRRVLGEDHPDTQASEQFLRWLGGRDGSRK